MLISQKAEMQEERERYKQKNVACEERILAFTRENRMKKKANPSTDRGIYNLFKCHVALYGITLTIATLKSEKMMRLILQELITLWNGIYELQSMVFYSYFDTYINKTIYLVASYILLITIVFFLYRVLSFRTTMWRFYYVNKGVKSRSKDRILLICVSEYIASVLFIIADMVLCNYMVLKWLGLTFIAGIIIYAPKVVIAYYKRLIVIKK